MPNPPPPGKWDWWFTAAVVIAAIAESALRTLPWKEAQLLYVAMAALVLPFRRTRPLAVTATVFGVGIALTLGTTLAGAVSDGIYSAAFIVVLPYSLLRWGSGRDAIIGLSVMVITPWIAIVDDSVLLSDAIGGSIFLLFLGAVGASVRYRRTSLDRAVEQARLQEREQLARELHDTVAHHVSAIAIQAQAGTTVAAGDPDAALRALDVIEREASRTLAEMRSMVGVLRRGEPVDLAPQPGVADIKRLTDKTANPIVEVELIGNLTGLPAPVDTAVYRLAQESVTNARRHAQAATSVLVRVIGDEDSVRLSVRDDGVSPAPPGANAGFGLAGMAERVKLLGGSFSAGPHPEQGWFVEAVVPRRGGTP